MRDYESIGASPCGETCVQLGSEDYSEKARAECRRFIDLIRTCCGPEPENAELIVKGSPHDYGTYYEVYVRFESESADASDYAYHCQTNAPAGWAVHPSHLPDPSKAVDPVTRQTRLLCGGAEGVGFEQDRPTCFRCAQKRAVQVRAAKKAAQTSTNSEASNV